MASNMQERNPLLKDADGVAIQGGSLIADILNSLVDDSAWTKISLPPVVECKAFYVKMRSGKGYKLSHDPAGTTYISLTGGFTMDMAKRKGSILFYLQSVEANDTAEVVLLV